MESNAVNFNFEYDLYRVPVPAWMNRVLKPSMESLYFYCDESLPLATDQKYDHKFLESVEGVVTQETSEAYPWWGKLEPLAKKTNCKLECHKANQVLDLWTPLGGVVSTWSELDEMMGEGRWRLKDPWMMGGTGQWRISRELLSDPGYQKGIETRLLKGPLLLEQSLDISKVIGTTFKLDESSATLLFSVENHQNSQGNFLGGEVIDTPTSCLSALNKMAKYWHEQGARGILEIDSFLLSEGEYPCVEVNHRKTMGWFIWHLQKKLGEGKLRLEKGHGIRLNPENAPLCVEWVKF
ncbi:MAG: hypothetical protein CME71_00855 [Halobacteriovorax sp.]|nr:hypothetical protein [Halobacteriovorax sp.]|tara:strand:- start:393 stop:1277 length:885 start_codon:yes stop_codon:yes gene_type:complete